MINNKIDKTLNFIDLDPKFLFSILRKYLIHLFIFVTLITIIVYLFSLNLDKKYKSSAKIVIEPDEKNIVNIQEYSNFNNNNRISILGSSASESNLHAPKNPNQLLFLWHQCS